MRLGDSRENKESEEIEGSALVAPTIAQIQQIAKAQNTTLVQYSEFGNETLYIWVVAPSGQVTFRQSDLSNFKISLSQLVTESRASIGVRSRATLVVSSRIDPQQQKQRLQQLYDILIRPIADLLPQDPNQPVIFIPQGPIFLAPFPALQDTSGKYLIEQHTILTAPSIQTLDLTHHQRQKLINKDTNALVLGNPLMPTVTPFPGEQPQRLASLPGAEKEANAIAPILSSTLANYAA